MRETKRSRVSLLMGLLLALALIAAACGGDEDGENGGGPEEGAVTQGGILQMAGIEDFDHLDPGQQYFQLTNAMLKGVVRALTAYSTNPDPTAPTELEGDLATDTGTPNEDNTEWTFTLQEGIKWGPALGGEEVPGVTGEEITSADVAYAFERIFTPSVGNQYSFYFEALEGAAEFHDGKADSISGIETPDEKTIIFHLTTPTPDWPSRVQFTAAAPVPESYASEFDQKKSSDYDKHVVASGPYYIESYTPGDELNLRRNEFWDPATDEDTPAYLDGMDWDLGFDEPNVVAQKIFDGEFDVTYDGRPEGPLLARATQDPDLQRNLVTGPAGATRYLWMNTTIKPFDDPVVRQAVNFAIDRENARRVYGGPAVGEVACSVLPAGIDGYLSCEEFNPYETPNMAGDMEKAKQMLADAGYTEADLSGEVFLVGASDTPHDKIAESVRADLEELGFSDVNVKLVAYPNQYTQFYSVPAKEVAFGTASGWVWDWPDAMTFFDPLFNGANIQETGNNNYSELDDAELNAAIDSAKDLEPGTEEYASLMEDLNRQTTESAVWVPWLWDQEMVAVNADNVQNVEWDASNGSIAWWQFALTGGGE